MLCANHFKGLLCSNECWISRRLLKKSLDLYCKRFLAIPTLNQLDASVLFFHYKNVGAVYIEADISADRNNFFNAHLYERTKLTTRFGG